MTVLSNMFPQTLNVVMPFFLLCATLAVPMLSWGGGIVFWSSFMSTKEALRECFFYKTKCKFVFASVKFAVLRKYSNVCLKVVCIKHGCSFTWETVRKPEVNIGSSFCLLHMGAFLMILPHCCLTVPMGSWTVSEPCLLPLLLQSIHNGVDVQGEIRSSVTIPWY